MVGKRLPSLASRQTMFSQQLMTSDRERIAMKPIETAQAVANTGSPICTRASYKKALSALKRARPR